MTLEPPPTSLLLFTTSQSPLPVRFPHPRKPILLLPPLVHRTLHAALDATPPSTAFISSSSQPTVIIPHPETLRKHDVPCHRSPPTRTSTTGTRTSTDHPAETTQPAFSNHGSEIDAEVTVKIHLIRSAPSTTRAEWVTNALDLLEKYKGLGSVDTLLVGFKGVDYKGKKTAASEMFGCGSEGLESGSGSEFVDEETTKEVEQVWRALAPLVSASKSTNSSSSSIGEPRVKALGTLYLPLNLLASLSQTKIPPAINSMDTPDCHHLPKEYSGFAKEQGIQLWAGGGGEGSDPLPAADLHNLLQEFYEQTLAPLSHLPVVNGDGPTGQALGTQIPLREDGLKYSDEVKRGVEVKWVLGYTLVSKTRNVLADKGYIISANLL